MTSLIHFIATVLTSFFNGIVAPTRKTSVEEKPIRDNLDEGQIDSMVDDSFPVSDPPSTY